MTSQLSVANPQLYKVLLGGKTKAMLTFNINGVTSGAINVNKMHHIHILDRSGSMHNHIAELIEDVKKTLRVVDRDDYVTVIWFSGHGEYRTVVKCAKNDPDSIDKILDSLKNTVGCTCFSDPIKELQEIIAETFPVCDIYNVTIFTDGDTVTPWPVNEETRRIFENLDAVKNKIIAFNAIGYGNYYNRELLLKMTKTTEYGQMTHAREIEEYSNIFSRNKEMIADLSGKKITIEAPGAEIVSLTSKTTKMWKEKAAIRLSKTRNTYGVIADESNGNLSIMVNNIPLFYDVSNIPVMDLDENADSTFIDLLYAYAYHLYYENRRKALEVLNLLGDRFLMDRQFSAFTVSEIGEYVKELKKHVFKAEKNNLLSIKSNSYIPDNNALCVLDVLKELVAQNAKYYPTENYKRIGRKIVDEFNCFMKDEEQEFVDMSGIVLNQDRLNISLRFVMKGKVKLNPKRAAPVGLPGDIAAKIYRVHTIVQDGALNIDKINVKLEKNNNSGFIDKLNDIKQIVSQDEKEVSLIIDLSKLPVINNSYLTGSAKTLLCDEIEMLNLEAESKAVKYLIKESAVPERWDGFTPEQVTVLKEHGFDSNMIYSAINPVRQEIQDYNIVKEFRTGIKGYSSLPSLNKIIQKTEESKKLTAPETLLFKYYKDHANLNKNELTAKLQDLKISLNRLRFKVSGNKLALILSGEWPSDLKPEDDGSFYCTDGNYTLVVKLERKEIPI